MHHHHYIHKHVYAGAAWKYAAIALGFVSVGSIVVVALYAASVITAAHSVSALQPVPSPVPTVIPPPGPVPTVGPPPPPGACTGINGATSPRISGFWINTNGPTIVAGQGYGNAADVDVVFLASFDPNPRNLNCSALPGNTNSLAPGNVINTLSIVGVVRANVKNGTKIVLSLGGSGFGTLTWCNLVAPFIENYTCGQVSSSGGGSCGSVNAYWENPGTTNCSKNTPPGYQPSFLHYYPGYSCLNQTCTCCCNADYTLTNGTCVLTPSSNPPLPDLCNYNTPYENTTAGIVNYMYDILVANNADGYDFDFENPDDGGHIAAGLVKFGIALQQYSQSKHRPLYTAMTLMSGPTYTISYGPLFECFRSSWCPFTWAVPMPYANCMYPYTGVAVYNESFNLTTQLYEVGTTVQSLGFTWNGLVDGWIQSHFTDASVTSLIMAVDTAVHESWFPCSFMPSDISIVYSDYTASHLPDACTHIAGLFFWYYVGFTPPAGLNFDYNTTWTTELINQWNRLIGRK